MKHLLSVLTLCFFVQLAFSQENKNIVRTSEKTYSVGLYAKPFRFERVNLGNEVTSKNQLFWDWAACLTMCLNYNGLNVLQEQVITLVNGPIEEPEGGPQDLMFAINKNTPTAWGKPSKVFTSTSNVSPDVIFDELYANKPLIIGAGSPALEGRAYVITAMAYNINYDAAGNQTGITPITVTLRDPWPNSPVNRQVNWLDFVNLTASLYTIKVEFKK